MAGVSHLVGLLAAGARTYATSEVEQASIQDRRELRELLTAPGDGAGERAVSSRQPSDERIAVGPAARARARGGPPLPLP